MKYSPYIGTGDSQCPHCGVVLQSPEFERHMANAHPEPAPEDPWAGINALLKRAQDRYEEEERLRLDELSKVEKSKASLGEMMKARQDYRMDKLRQQVEDVFWPRRFERLNMR